MATASKVELRLNLGVRRLAVSSSAWLDFDRGFARERWCVRCCKPVRRPKTCWQDVVNWKRVEGWNGLRENMALPEVSPLSLELASSVNI
jgi:hypothetical protein